MRRLVACMAVLVGAAPVAAQAPGPFIERMTWEEIRDAMQAGARTVIVPIGGTEQNGPHMVLGKHNYIVRYTAAQIAERLGGTLIAPVIQYVPEGDHEAPGFGDKPGVITNPSPSYDALLDATARSLAVHGFTEILFIGDSGGNQAGMSAVADSLNREWQATATRVFALTDYYRRGQADLRAWLLAEFGYDAATVGSHAGISDTSQMLFVQPDGIRRDRILPGGGGPDSGVRGDPTRATADIGRAAIEFKVGAAIAQVRELRAALRQ